MGNAGRAVRKAGVHVATNRPVSAVVLAALWVGIVGYYVAVRIVG